MKSIFFTVLATIALALPVVSRAQSGDPAPQTPAPQAPAPAPPSSEREETRYRSETGTSTSTRGYSYERRRDSKRTRYLFGDWESTGAFGSFFLEYGSLNGRDLSYAGGGGALIINEVFLIGGYGEGLLGTVTLIPNDASLFNGNPGKFDMSHGGFWLGGVILPHAAVHPTVTSRLGWGTARWDGTGLSDAIFVVTPMVGVQANINSWMRINLEGGYRFVTGLQLPGVTTRGLDGYSIGLSFQFGDFD